MYHPHRYLTHLLQLDDIIAGTLPPLTQSTQAESDNIEGFAATDTQWFENEDAEGSSDVDMVDDDPKDLSTRSQPFYPRRLTSFIAYQPTQPLTQLPVTLRTSPRRSGN